LPELTNLTLSRTPVCDLAPLAGISSLQVLDIRGTKVHDVSRLGRPAG
jgi:Leucine-rich repeat (LRR) protein